MASRHLTTLTVDTGIRAGQIVIDARHGRIVVVGQTDVNNANTSGNGVAIVDMLSRRLIARIMTNSMSIALGLSERNALAYVVTGDPASTTSMLWAIDLRSGAVRRRIPLPITIKDAIGTVGVDDAAGHLFVVSASSIIHDNLTMLSAQGAVLRTQPLPVTVAQLYIDPSQHRVVVAPRTGNGVFDGTFNGAFFAFDTRSGTRVWSQTYAYPFVGITPDDAGHRLWTLTAGGRVSVVSIATGHTVAMHPVYHAPADWTQGPVVVDGQRATAYVTWCAAHVCHLDVASLHARARRTITTLTTARETLAGSLPDFTPFGVDVRRRQVLGYSIVDGRLSALDEQTGRRVATLTGPLSIETTAVAQSASHLYIAASVLTTHDSDTTGTTRTSAVTILTR